MSEADTCEPATDEDMFYVSMGEHLVKESLPTLNHSLRHVVTLSAALFAGTVAISKEHIAHSGVSLVCMVLLLVALGASGIALIPHESKIIVRCPADIREAIKSGILWKKNILIFAAIMVFMALAIMLIGIVVN